PAPPLSIASVHRRDQQNSLARADGRAECLLQTGLCGGAMGLHLVIGTTNSSSWSMRPWIGMKAAGIPFDETVISLDAPDFKSRLPQPSGAAQGAARVA